jgi:hypothetical protein
VPVVVVVELPQEARIAEAIIIIAIFFIFVCFCLLNFYSIKLH